VTTDPVVRQPYQAEERRSDHRPYFEMLQRMVKAAGRRVAQADAEDLTLLIAIRADLDQAIQASVDGLRAGGCTWQLIGDATGTSRQAAIQKWNR
jgi:hypothetical protein